MSGNEASIGIRALSAKASGDFSKKVELPEDVAEIASVVTEADIQEAAKSIESSFGGVSESEFEAASEYLSCIPMKSKVILLKTMLKSHIALVRGVAEFKADCENDLETFSDDVEAEHARGKAKMTKLGVLETVYGKMIMKHHELGVSAVLSAEAITRNESKRGDKFFNKRGELVSYTYNAAAIKTFVSAEKKRRLAAAKAAKAAQAAKK